MLLFSFEYGCIVKEMGCRSTVDGGIGVRKIVLGGATAHVPTWALQIRMLSIIGQAHES